MFFCLLISSTFWLACSGSRTAQCCQYPSDTPHSTSFPGTPITSAEIWSANLAVAPEDTRVVVGKDEITLTARVHNPGPDDCSGETKIIVLLPRESEILSFAAQDEDGNSLPMSQCSGYLCCTVRDGLCSRDPDGVALEGTYDVFITVRTRPSPKGLPAQFAIMTYGAAPEADMSNNFWFWR